MISNLSQLRRTDKSRIRKIEGAYYIVCGKNCYQANETGALIVNAIGKDIAIKTVCEKLASIYGYADTAIIEVDVHTFLDFLLDNKIVYLNEVN